MKFVTASMPAKMTQNSKNFPLPAFNGTAKARENVIIFLLVQ
jgi:hypothetical protein